MVDTNGKRARGINYFVSIDGMKFETSPIRANVVIIRGVEHVRLVCKPTSCCSGSTGNGGLRPTREFENTDYSLSCWRKT